MKPRKTLLVCAVLLLASGAALTARHGYMLAKAGLAVVLIDRAFSEHLKDGTVHRPWSWADMHPIARLELQRLDVRRDILSGASGESLAFGIGHVDGTAYPNRPGNCVLAGHRDSWASFLEDVSVGDRFYLTTHEQVRKWQVERIDVVGVIDTTVLEQDAGYRLTLLTCYPFGGLTRSPWRYVVICSPVHTAIRAGIES